LKSEDAKWETWTETECIHLLQKNPTYIFAVLRYAQLSLHKDLNKSQQLLKEVIKIDKTFQVAKVAELQGDIYW
jgi:tetratricopeptide (TPR) repeat protein